MIIPTNLNFGIITLLVASIGGVVAAWRQIQAFLQKIVDLAVCRSIIKGDLSPALQSYIFTRGKRSPFGLKVFGGIKNYVNPNKRIEIVGYETISSDPLLIWFNKRPAIIKRFKNDGGGNAPDIGNWGSSGDSGPLQIYFFRGTFDMEKFLTQIIESYNEIHHKEKLDKDNNQIQSRFQVIRLKNNDFDGAEKSKRPRDQFDYGNDSTDLLSLLKTNSARLIKWDRKDLIENADKSPFNSHPFPPEVTDILQEITLWKENGNWFKERGIPWRRGYILTGSPGCGKSTLVKSIGQEYDMPIYMFDLARETNITFPENFQKIQASSPAIALIEDIDSIFQGRQNITRGLNPKDSLTFDCLLNTISGVGNSDGVLLFITTNNIESLDSAIGVSLDGKSSRPGRIDKILYLGKMKENERRKLALLILGDFPDLIEDVVKLGHDETAAQFQDRCAQMALKKFWKNKNLKQQNGE